MIMLIGWGISNSDLRNTAAMPIKKNQTKRFRTLERIKLESILFFVGRWSAEGLSWPVCSNLSSNMDADG